MACKDIAGFVQITGWLPANSLWPSDGNRLYFDPDNCHEATRTRAICYSDPNSVRFYNSVKIQRKKRRQFLWHNTAGLYAVLAHSASYGIFYHNQVPYKFISKNASSDKTNYLSMRQKVSVHSCYTLEAEAGGLLQVPGQPWLQKETRSKKQIHNK